MSESISDTAVVEVPIGLARVKAIVVDAVGHALPLVPFYFYHGSVPAYLLLTAFDLALGLMLIVGTTREAKDPTTVDPRATLISRITAALVLAGFLGGVAAFLTIPLGIPAFISGMEAHVDWIALVTRPGFYLPVVLMALSAGVRAQLRFEAATRVGNRGTSSHAGPIVGDLARDRRMAKAALRRASDFDRGLCGVGLRAERSGAAWAFYFPTALRRAAGLLRCAAGYRTKNSSRSMAGSSGATGGKKGKILNSRPLVSETLRT